MLYENLLGGGGAKKGAPPTPQRLVVNQELQIEVIMSGFDTPLRRVGIALLARDLGNFQVCHL